MLLGKCKDEHQLRIMQTNQSKGDFTHILMQLTQFCLTVVTGWMLSQVAMADVTAPQAPPELSDTLTDFRTKEQLTEQIYIEGRVDKQNSLQIPTAASDLKAKVLRMSAMYQTNYEIVVPRYGVSVVRFYDLEGYPMDIESVTLDRPGYIAEKTAVSYELILRQFQGAENNLLRVKFKRFNQPAILVLRPIVLVNQYQPVRTLITCLTINYNAEKNTMAFAPFRFHEPDVTLAKPPVKTEAQRRALKADPKQLEQNLLHSAMVVMPLSINEQVDAQEIMDKLSKDNLIESPKPVRSR